MDGNPSDLDFLRMYAKAYTDYDDDAFVSALTTQDDDKIGLAHPINWVTEAEGETILVDRSMSILYAEHRDTEMHTGDVYVIGCPTCEGWSLDEGG